MQITNHQEISKYYNALVKKDSQFIGVFYAGVKTTGIFCIATCRARKPKKENVTFYTTAKELLQHGFRPCKICKPTDHAHEPIEEVKKALEMIRLTPKEKIKDYQLRQAGIQPEKIRRWFKKNHGITFHAYQRMLRINNAFQEMKKGKTITDSAFSNGYDSLSGFGYTFKALTGKTPNQGKEKNSILLKRITSPLGPMFIGSTDKGICLLEFTDRRMLETEFRDLQVKLNAVILSGENEHTQLLERELNEYFKGKLSKFTVPLDAPGTTFQQDVWNELINIPYGKTRSYQEQAIKIGNPKAVRAVARANGMNRISIVIPCHRVIGKDGTLTGYGGGLDRKKWLLELEKENH